MKKYLIPNIKDLEKSCKLAAENECVFEYNDFYNSDILDDEKKQKEVIYIYKNLVYWQISTGKLS